MGCTVSKSRVVVSSIREQQQSMTSIAPPATQSSASSVGLQDSQEAERVSSSTPKGDVADSLTIVHFNDVYEVQERKKEPVGGAARFKTAVDSVARKLNPLVVFSGDCLNPSALSVVTKGKHMVPILNSLGVHLATYGNHEFDFGVEHLVEEIASQTEFPWLMGNVRDRETGRLLAEGRESHILDWNGRKIGFIGLVEKEWLVTLATIELEELEFTDYVECARQLLPSLQGCDLVVAVTHMRWPNDRRLAREVPEINLILGGHDHDYQWEMINDTLVIKSGSDFRDFSEIAVDFSNSRRPTFDVVRHTITRDVPPDPDVAALVAKYCDSMEDRMKESIGSIECDLEGRFSRIRTGETNLGNLVTDIMRSSTRSEIALLNSGTFRSNAVHEAGVFRVKDLMTILPMVDPLWKLEVSGEQLLQALENGVSQYPSLEGRFPQVSGVSFTFDPSRLSFSRVCENTVLINGEPLERGRTYTLCTKGYIARGKDGYSVFRSAKILMDHEAGIILNSEVRNFFQSCRQLMQQNHHHHHSLPRVTSPFRTSSISSRPRIHPQVEGRITHTSSG
jgi:5'-nucleotidase